MSWRPLQVLKDHTPAPPSRFVLQVVTADQAGVGTGLLRGQVCHQPPVFEGSRVAINHEQASRWARKRNHVARTTLSIEVATEHPMP